MSKLTPLFSQHQLAKASMVDFYGWQMPIHYGSQIQEHLQVRQDAGVFDVSHMTVVDLLGAGGRQFLRHLLANDVDKLAHPGQALYTCMLNQHGGIIDDLIVYFRALDNYRLVLNAATRENDLRWLRHYANGFTVGVFERSEFAMLAVQGPNAMVKTLPCLTPTQMDAVSTLQSFESVDAEDWFIARTGYTGEDGLEIMLPAEKAPEFWQALLRAGVKPCGLGARDTLRLEAGLLLYGQDMDEHTTPLESGLAWTVAWQPENRDFIGHDALLQQKQRGVKRKLVGLVLQEKGVMRSQQKVLVDNIGEGIITSGSFSPTLQKSIALARVPCEIQASCLVDIRGKLVPASVTAPRFVKHGQSIL